MAKTLRAIKPNPGIRTTYNRRLQTLVEQMHRSVLWWTRACYRQQERRIVHDHFGVAMDESPWSALTSVLGFLFRYWMRKWTENATRIAEAMVLGARRKTRSSFLSAFKQAGMTVKMKPSRAMNDVVGALIAENVSLIKSIPSRYFDDITAMVQRHASQGKDLAALEEEIFNRYNVTQRRAKFIARDQSDKASEAIKRTECRDLGITEGIWVHVPGTKSARATHMRMNGKRFRLDEGLYDADVKRKVLTGELPGCRCTYRAVIPDLGE